jgi:hypothetical protein
MKYFLLLALASVAHGANALLLDAIMQVESNGDSSAIGDRGNAVGAYQIHKIYVDDVNRILGKAKYTYDCRKDKAKSRRMTEIYIDHYGRGKTDLQKARIHNGGPRGHKKKVTIKYAQKIKLVLDKGK